MGRYRKRGQSRVENMTKRYIYMGHRDHKGGPSAVNVTEIKEK